MAHEHEVIDKDLHFVIDPEMDISCAGTVKALKRGDHKSERYTFEMPRYIEGHDMSLCNKVEVHYNNIKYDSATRETTTNKSFDDVQGFGISATSEDTVVWTWLVQGDATELDGTLNFCIRFACMNGDEIEYQKFTEIYASIPVGDTIFNTEVIAKKYADVLEAWRQELLLTDEDIANAVAEYLKENPLEETDPTVPEWAKQPDKPAYTAAEVGAKPSDMEVTITGDTSDKYLVEIKKARGNGRQVYAISDGDRFEYLHPVFRDVDGSGVQQMFARFVRYDGEQTIKTIDVPAESTGAVIFDEFELAKMDDINSKSVFYINCTKIGDEEGFTILNCDRSFAEVDEAYQAGRSVECRYESGIYRLITINSDESFMFALVDPDADLTMRVIVIVPNGAVLVISKIITEYDLSEAINTALAQAKASGEFKGEKGDKGDKGEQGEPGKDGNPGADGQNGKDGYSPVRGTDYWTDADKAEIKAYVDTAILGGAW